MKGAHQSYRSFNIWVFWQHNDDAEAPLVRAHPLHLQIAVESAQFLAVLKAELTQKRNAEAVWAVSFQRQAAEKLTDGHTRYARKFFPLLLPLDLSLNLPYAHSLPLEDLPPLPPTCLLCHLCHWEVARVLEDVENQMKLHRTMPLPVKSVGPLVRPADQQNHGPCSTFVCVSSYQLPPSVYRDSGSFSSSCSSRSGSREPR
eukprot:s9517_g4.t1